MVFPSFFFVSETTVEVGSFKTLFSMFQSYFPCFGLGPGSSSLGKMTGSEAEVAWPRSAFGSAAHRKDAAGGGDEFVKHRPERDVLMFTCNIL